MFLVVKVRKRYKGSKFATPRETMLAIMLCINIISFYFFKLLIINTEHLFKDNHVFDVLYQFLSLTIFWGVLFISISAFLVIKLNTARFDHYQNRNISIKEKFKFILFSLLIILTSYIFSCAIF